jgi:hypothetical protein
MAMPWPAYLDALEEWTRRADAAVRGGEDLLEPLAADPAGTVPAELALRARALLARMHQLQSLAERRRRELDRARSYEQD